MLKKTLIAAAVAGLSLSARAADSEPQSPPNTDAKPLPRPDEEAPVQLQAVQVRDSQIDEGFKAEEQSSSNKIPLRVRETPQSVSVITRQSLDARQAMTLGQALELSAGVTQYSGNGPFAGQPTFGFNQTTIRGIDTDSEFDFREDGFVNGSYFSLPDLAIYERIEVVKGPSSITYGRGSAGGIINRVRKKPLAQAQTDIELSAGSFDSYRADLDTTGPLLSSQSVRGRLVAAYEDNGSFVRGVESQRTVLAPSLDVDLSPTTRLTLLGLYQSEDIIPNTGFPLRSTSKGYAAPKISRRQYNGVITEDPFTWKTLSATLQLDQQIGDDWLGSLRLNSSNIETPLHADAYAYGFREEGDDPETLDVVERRGDTAMLADDLAIDRDVWSGELQLSGQFDISGHAVKAAFGADYSDNQYSRRGSYTDYSTIANLYDGNFIHPETELIAYDAFGRDPRSSGAYAQAQISASERLKVLLGLRYDRVKARSFNGEISDQEIFSKTTGRVGLTYDLSQQVSVYTLYSQSFQPVSSTDINQEILDPETGEIYEIGAKSEWFAGKLGVNVAAYRVDRDKIPIGVDVPPGATQYSISSGLQRSQGFEVEINGRPAPGWDLSLAYNQLDSKFKDPDDPFYGQQPGGAADWQLGAYSAYELQTGPLKGLGFGATLFAIDDRGISGFQTGTIPGYERIDLHAFYKGIKNVEINLLVRNLGNERYIEGADRSSAYAQFGSPTAAMLSLRYQLAAR